MHLLFCFVHTAGKLKKEEFYSLLLDPKMFGIFTLNEIQYLLAVLEWFHCVWLSNLQADMLK